MKLKDFKRKAQGLVLLWAVFSFVSCNKEIEHKIAFTEPDESGYSNVKTYRVAYIVIDGAVGSVVGAQATDYNNMPFLARLSQNGLFSWNSIASDATEDITFYADLLTGVQINKHGVDSDDLSNANLNQYPLLFERVKQGKNIRTAVISDNQALDILTNSSSAIDNKQFLSSDDQVVSAAKYEFSRADAGVTVVTLNEVDQVGKQHGYGPDSELYLTALRNTDNRLRELVETIEGRENYGSEQWLIVVASNRGGDYELDPHLDDNSLYSIPLRNNFVLFYNRNFNYRIVQRMDLSDPTYDGAAVRYTGTATTAQINATNSSIYNLGNNAESGDYTIQLKLKVHTLGTNNPTFISKMGNTGNSDDGWSFIYNGGSGWRLKVKGVQVIDGDPFNLEEWYTLTAKIYNDNGTRRGKIFRNGVLKAEGNIGNVVGSSNESLKLGYGTAWGSGASHSVTDVRFYNTALPDEYIAENYCSTAVYDDDPYWTNLTGYWPAIEGSGNEIADHSGNRRHFLLTGSVAWNSFSERGGGLCPTAPQFLDRATVRSVDAPLMIYNWLGIMGTDGFNLDAQVWAPNYAN